VILSGRVCHRRRCALGRTATSKIPIRTIHAALDAGINTIDTAPIYNFGESERGGGQGHQGRRDQVILSTKCGLRWDNGEEAPTLLRVTGTKSIENLTRASIAMELRRACVA
jgi:methylglyoxal reductase